MDELNSEKKVAEDIEYDDASSDEKETESEKFCANIGKGKAPLTHALIMLLKILKQKKVAAKPHEKNSVVRLQLPAMSQLAAAVNSLVKVNTKKMAIEKKDRKSLLEFRREEAEKHENMKIHG